MAKVTIFAGLCGSGKTFESKKLEQQYFHQEVGVAVFSEIFDQDNGADKRRTLLQSLNDGVDCIVEEDFCCGSHWRTLLLKELYLVDPKPEIEWVLFEKDLETANENVKIRTNEIMESKKQKEIERLQSINEDLFRRCDFPKEYTRKPIHRRTQ